MSFAAIAQFAPALLRRADLARRQCAGRGARHGRRHPRSGPTRCSSRRSPRPTPTSSCTGLFGFEALRPQALFGTVAEPLNHGVMWSLSINTLFFVLGSLSRASVPLERIQASIFVPRDASPMPSLRRFRTAITVNDLKDTIVALSRRRAHRALVPVLRDEQRQHAARQRAGRHGRHPLFRAAAGQRGRLVLGAADPVAAVQAQRQRIARTPSACSTTPPRRCSTIATCCRSRSTRWSRASPSSTRISA